MHKVTTDYSSARREKLSIFMNNPEHTLNDTSHELHPLSTSGKQSCQLKIPKFIKLLDQNQIKGPLTKIRLCRTNMALLLKNGD